MTNINPYTDRSHLVSACELFRFGDATQERSIRALLLYTLVNKLQHLLFDARRGGHNRQPNFCSSQWQQILALFAHIRSTVLVPPNHHSDIIFLLDASKSAQSFADKRLIRVSATFLTNPQLARMVTHEATAGMIRNVKGKKKKLIEATKRHLSGYGKLFQGLDNFVANVETFLSHARKRKRRSAAAAASAAVRKQKKQNERKKLQKEHERPNVASGEVDEVGREENAETTLSEQLKELSMQDTKTGKNDLASGSAVMGVRGMTGGRGNSNSGDSKIIKLLRHSANDKHSITHIYTTALGICANLMASLTDTLGVKTVKSLRSEKGVIWSESTVFDALVFSIEKLENSQNMVAMQSLATTALGGSFGPMGRGNRGEGELQMLLKPQVEELDRQILAKNLLHTAEDGKGGGSIYRARLSGVLVTVNVLNTTFIHPATKKGLLLHQKLSTSPFVVQMFGLGHSLRNGWFVALQHIERSLEDLITAWPPLPINKLIAVGVDIANGFTFLPEAGVFHRDICPGSILVTNTFKAKIADFRISEDIRYVPCKSCKLMFIHTRTITI